MTQRLATTVGVSAVVISVITTVATVLLLAIIRSDNVIYVLPLLSFPTVGAMIVSHRPGNGIGWLLTTMGTATVLGTGFDAYARYSLEKSALPGFAWIAWMTNWVSVFSLAVMVLGTLLIFPTGKLLSDRWRWVALSIGLVITLDAVHTAFLPGRLNDFNGDPGIDNPIGIALIQQVGEWLVLPGMIATAFVLLAPLAALILRYRRARGEERLQLKWFTLIAGVATVSFIVTSLLLAILEENRQWLADLLYMFTFYTMTVGLAVSIGIAVLKYRLYAIDHIINRTLVYGTLSTILLVVYLALVFGAEGLVQSAVGEDSSLVVAGSTLVVAALFRPLRARIQATVDRRFYRRKYDAARTLEAFNLRLRDETDLDMLSAELQELIHTTMQPAHLFLWLRDVPVQRTPERYS